MQLFQVEIFAGLTPLERDALAASSSTVTLARNTVVFNEGDPADALYLIEAGRVKVYACDRNGKEYIFNVMGPGEYFGELALLDDEPRSASVRTLEEARFRVVTRGDFQRVLDDHPGMARTLIRNLTTRIRQLTRDVRSLALEDVYGRVTKLLKSLAEPVDDARHRVPERLTQQEIADRVGASREMVARILKDLSAGGYIRWEGRHIVIVGRLPAKY